MVPVFLLTAFFPKALSKPERHFSGTPSMPFPTFLSLLLHVQYLTKSLTAQSQFLRGFTRAFTLHLRRRLQPPWREDGCGHHQHPVCHVTQQWLHTLTHSLSSFRSELSLKVSGGVGGFGGERMVLCCRLSKISALFIPQSINQTLL